MRPSCSDSAEQAWQNYQKVFNHSSAHVEASFDVRARLARCRILLDARRNDEAAELAQAITENSTAIELTDLNARAWALHSEAVNELGDREGAETSLQKGRQLLDEAATILEKLEVRPLVGRLLGIRERLAGLGPADPVGYPDGLSEREVEVLRFMAAGLSNQQIADELFLSRYTVVRHVANIFGKIGVSNRVEATGYAHEHNLTVEST